MTRSQEALIPSFQQQADRLVELGYPNLADRTETDFRALLEPLRTHAADLPDVSEDGGASYVVVVTRDVVPPERTVPLLRLTNGQKPGVVDRNHPEGDLAAYHPTETSRPPASAYLLVDVERGEEFRNVPPEVATATIVERGRSPLTIDEGIAVVTQIPALLEKNKCFMLAGSRRTGLPGDRRVPALWISERAPKLGWCWDGNPHTWLGTASAGSRVAAG